MGRWSSLLLKRSSSLAEAEEGKMIDHRGRGGGRSSGGDRFGRIEGLVLGLDPA